MALIELNLEKPALKRTETGGSSTKQSRRGTSDETESTTSGKSTSRMVEMPEGERVDDEDSSGGGMMRRLLMLGATAGAVVALRRWRSRRKESQSSATEFEEEWETPRSE